MVSDELAKSPAIRCVLIVEDDDDSREMLGELVSSYTTIRNKGGDVKLLKLTTKTKDLLQMTKLLTVFDVYDDEAKAVASLKGQK